MTVTVLIDGPSGAGKTTFARQLAQRLGARVVHLDDLYPGWDGLCRAADLVASSLLSLRDPGYHQWDWEAQRQGTWVSVDPAQDLVVEGAGALSAGSLAAARRRGAVLSVVIDAPVALRKHRALTRDQGLGYEEYWQMWAQQEREHFSSWVPNGVVPDFHLVSGHEGLAMVSHPVAVSGPQR